MRSAYLGQILLCLSAYGPCMGGSSLCAADDLDKAVLLQSVVSTSSARAAEDERTATDEKNEKTWFVKAHTNSYNTQWMSLAAWLTYTIMAAGFALWSKPQEHSEQSASPDKVEKVREHHWDVAKAWFMMLVVCNHIPKQGDVGATLMYPMLFRFEMPGFSLVSGLMAASLVRQPALSNSSILENEKLLNRFRDLILVNFTCPPLTVVLCVLLRSFAMLSTSPLTSAMTHGSVAYGVVRYGIFDVPLLKIPSTWVYWFLPTLFLWYLVTPTFRLLRFPFTLSLMTTILCGTPGADHSVATEALGLFPFFVAGFLLGGGCLPAEQRTECRKELANYARSNIARGIAAALLVAWFAVLAHLLPHLPAYMTFTSIPFAWAQGGAVATLTSFCISMLGVVGSIVMCFAVPESVAAVVGRVGSRTLYIYLLHVVAITDLHTNEHGQMVTTFPWQPQSVYMRSIVLGIEAMWITALLGSDLTINLTHHFVQPQWLVNFLTSSQPIQKEQASTGAPGKISES